jgi:50S ribosomal protein L16 3-hydroxylase
MVSYATPGGGVGAHFDSYDVFLLQGDGRRRWRISAQRDLALRPALPLKILARFRPTAQWTLEPGDMLYLPPDRAHEGVAVDTCTTYSIGFRTPSAQELGNAFLDRLRDDLALDGRYADPDLAPAREPARIDAAMHARCAQMLSSIRWDERTVSRFLGCHLSEPKPNVFFDAPERTLPLRRFAAMAIRRGLRLDLRTQILYDAHNVYINGTWLVWPPGAAPQLKRLANARRLAGDDVNTRTLASVLHRWYHDGFIDFD